MKRKLVSIIVPVYGEENELPRCVDSIRDQTYSNIEIILVDDGSPDRCPMICDKYALQDERIRVIHKANAGLVEARKTGLKQAQGEFICYVDGDDYIENNMIEEYVKIMEQTDSDIVIDGFTKEINGKRIKYKNLMPIGVYEKKEIDTVLKSNMISVEGFYSFGIFTYFWNKLFKKNILDAVQPDIDSRLIVGEDAACVYPAILQSNRVSIVDCCLYHYCVRPGSLLRKKRNGNTAFEKLMYCKEYMENAFKDDCDKDILYEQTKKYIYSQMIMMSDCLTEVFPWLDTRFPFANVPAGSRVILYSSGAFGMHLYTQLRDSDDFNIVGWCDPDPESYEPEVESPLIVLRREYDYLIIASVDYLFIEETKHVLHALQVDASKIVCISDSLADVFSDCDKMIESGSCKTGEPVLAG